jgi:hypothetical protein
VRAALQALGEQPTGVRRVVLTHLADDLPVAEKTPFEFLGTFDTLPRQALQLTGSRARPWIDIHSAAESVTSCRMCTRS